MTRRPGIVTLSLAAAAVMSGCASTLPSPEPEWVEPPRGFGGDAQPVDIFGSAFHPLIVADASGAGGDTVDTEFQVELIDPADGSVASVARATLLGRGSSHLQAVIPAGVQVGLYDLRVTGPDGASGVAPGAYRVTSSPVEKLQVVVPPPGEWFVGQRAEIELQLLGRDDLEELANLPIRVELERTDLGPIAGGLSSNLIESAPLDLGTRRLGLAGVTRADGSGILDIAMPDPGVFNLTVSIPDPDVGLDPVKRTLTWLPGDVYDVQVALPGPDFQVTAGMTFPVELTLRDKETGAVVEQPSIPVRVILSDRCGDMGGGTLVEDLKGTRTELVSLQTATADAVPFGGCDAQALRVQLASDSFESAPIRVVPGPSERLSVQPLSSSVVAGSAQRAIVRVSDRFQNVTGDSLEAGALLLTDTVGDIDASGCAAIDGGAFCVVTPTDAERAVSLLVEDPRSGLQGTSAPYAVLASIPDSYKVLVDPAAGIQAGSTFPAIVRVFDEYGNDADTTIMVEGDVVVTDAFGESECAWLGPAERGELSFSCSLFTARRTRLVATADGASGDSAEFDVVNAGLSRVEVSTNQTEVTAGERFQLTLYGFDAWSNPFIVRGVDRIDLRSELGGLDIDHAMFGIDGRATAEARLLRAGEDVIIADFTGFERGRSRPMRVTAGAADSLTVVSTEPWAFVGDRVEIDVQAIDAFGNPSEHSDTVSVTSRWGTFSAASTSLVDGRGTASVTFNAADLAEEIQAESSGGLKGSQLGYIVGKDCGGSGPSLSLQFGTARDAVVCHDGSSAEIDASFKGSAAADGTLPRVFALWTQEAGTRVGMTDRLSLTSTRIGKHELRGLVADSGACAVEVERHAWVGLDDGEPVGPMDVELTTSRLDIGSDKTTVSLTGVTACDGVVADKGRVYLRTDRGVLTGPSLTGTGLQVKLDSTGSASVTLDLLSEHTGGAGTLTASVASGAAGGEGLFTAEGDTQAPRVVSQDPHGYATGSIDRVQVGFSEPLDPASVDEAAFDLLGPSSIAIDEVELSSDARSVTVWLADDADAGAGRWTVSVHDGILDLEGNALDGDWSGVRSDYEGDFGKVSAIVPDITDCTTANPTFRPDGDPGTKVGSIESEQVDIQVEASRTPYRWRLQVHDAAGSMVFADRVAATGKIQDLAWDGRDDSGRVLGDALYTITIWGVNADGSAGTSCVRKVTVDNDRGL